MTLPRRAILKVGFGGLCLGAMSPVSVLGQNDPAAGPPQKDDLLNKDGDAAAKPLTAADIPLNGPFATAWPVDPATRIIRNGNRLNQVLLIRVDPRTLSGAVLESSAEGVLAYSAWCPHAGCNVNDWIPETGILACDCHASEFDSRASGKVVNGPASRALPLLPLKSDGGVLVVAGSFPSAIRFDE